MHHAGVHDAGPGAGAGVKAGFRVLVLGRGSAERGVRRTMVRDVKRDVRRGEMRDVMRDEKTAAR